MRVRTPFPAGAGPLLGAVAGALVGIVDGARAAFAFGVDLRSVATVIALSVAVDALWGFAIGKVVEVFGRLAVWGRRAPPPLWARGLAFLLAGALAMASAGAACAVTLDR